MARNRSSSAPDVRKRQNKRYRSRYHYEREVNFAVGDYVLRSRVDEKQHFNKLRVTWVGPYRATGAAEYYFIVEHLVTRKTVKEHPSRPKHYADSSLNTTADLIDHVASQGTLLTVDSLVDYRYNNNMKAFEVKVKWQGLEDIEDSWEPAKTLSKDVPQLMTNDANDTNDERLRHAVAAVLHPPKIVWKNVTLTAR
ncbi:chromodomain protein, putative [Phytophthora infestans T30-4]|uniref:Chromodomain protein, putative n=1 Tax=Phytophthora infestans (strain T30-4) TaxID=403677 RepID=D0N4L3_PHYIT|nr:chromodomain protein, putative [Phytophthora infestans T30-4]EEY69821.1 chromodomain protein, putative [Phytophthora infestans T30-4]|eukprot:XP_002998468.1 chromodomain protein, putative [Phytophthora infestans T30-4]